MTQKNAPAAVGAADEGEITTTPEQEQIMNTEQPTFTPTASDSEKLAEWIERTLAKRAAWLAEHPEVLTATSWHETIEVELDELDNGVGLFFEKDLGPVRIMQTAVFSDGALAWDGPPSVIVDGEFREDITVGQMRQLASALMAAIPVVEAAQVHP